MPLRPVTTPNKSRYRYETASGTIFVNFVDPTGRCADGVTETDKGFWGYLGDEFKEFNEAVKGASNAICDSMGNFLMNEAPAMAGDALHLAVGDVQHDGYSDTYKKIVDPDRPTVEAFGVDFDAPIMAIPVTETVAAFDAGYDVGTAALNGEWNEVQAGIFIFGVEFIDRRTPGNIDNPVDLTDFRKDHILNRHGPGRGMSDKTEFPANWTDEKVLHEISDVATDPSSTVEAGRWGADRISGTRDGVDITVDMYPPNSKHAGKISTGYPTNTSVNQ